jgi:hypothetical protein
MRVAIALVLGSAAAAALAAGHVSDETLRKFVEQSRKVSAQLIQQIGGEMRKEVEATGPMRAVMVCKYTAPEVASSLSRMNGMRITRVSLKPRNPSLGYPDPWEQTVLADFERRAARGEKVEAIEFAEAVSEPSGVFLRYMKAIPTGKVCLSCHGPVEQMSEAVKAQIANEYPHDRAVGFVEGSIRGAVTVKKPL